MRANHLLSVSSLALACGIVWGAASARAADMAPVSSDNPYISLFGGLNFARMQMGYEESQYDVKLKDGFTIGAAYGRHIGNGFRVETELSFVANDNKSYRTDNGAYDPDMDGETNSLFILGNVWKDFQLSNSVQPYIGAGLGTAYSSSKESLDNNWDGSSIALAAQVGAGVRVALTDRLALDAGYRLRAAIDATTSSVDGDSNGVFSHYSHTAQVGLTYALGDGQVMPQDAGEPGDWYTSLFGGAVFTASDLNIADSSQYMIKHKTGFTVGAAVGTHMAPGLRAELELSYARSALDSYTTTTDNADSPAGGHLNQTYVLANLWRDIDLGGPVTPYIGGGIGLGFMNFSNADLDGDFVSSDTGMGLAGQFGIGARMAVSDNMSLDVGYRFKSIVDALIIGGNDFTDNGELATTNHVIQVGVNYGPGLNSGSNSGVPDSTYVSLFGGGVFAADTHGNVDGHDYLVDFKTGFTVGAALGSNITEKLRGEIEASVQHYNVKSVQDAGTVEDGSDGDITGYFVMANLWRDMEIGPFKPYIGGGIGVGLVDVFTDFTGDNHIIDGTSMALAAQVGSGIRYDLTDNVMLDVGYRFRAVNAISTKDVTTFNTNYNSSSYYTQTVQAGVTWKF